MAFPNQNPVLPYQPDVFVSTLAAANTARDGSGSISTLVTGSANGTQVKLIRISSAQATAAANSAMVIRLWISKDTGATWSLMDEAVFSAVTASNTAKGQQLDFTYNFPVRIFGVTQLIGWSKSVHAGVADQLQAVAFVDTLG